MNRLIYILGVVALLVSCKPTVPDGVIEQGDMEDILVDYHLARAMAQVGDGPERERRYNELLYTEEVFRKHGVTKADFDSSLVYYYGHGNRFGLMYEAVSERLDKQALAFGATEGEIGKYASLKATGDTANVWVERTTAFLTPVAPFNRLEFEMEIDSTYQTGDSFLMQFVSDYIYQSGTKDGILVLSLTFENDSTITRTNRFPSSGINSLRVEGLRDVALSRLRGFFYLNGDHEHSSSMRLLFLSNIQLIRFHNTDNKNDVKHEEPTLQKDSVESVATAERSDSDSASHRNKFREGLRLPTTEGGTAIHGMAKRVREAQTR